MERLSEWLIDIGDMHTADANRLSKRLGKDGILTIQTLCNHVRANPDYLSVIGVDRLDIEGILGALAHEISRNSISEFDIPQRAVTRAVLQSRLSLQSQPISDQTALDNLISSIRNKEYSVLPVLFHSLVDFNEFIKNSRQHAESIADKGGCEALGQVLTILRSIISRSVMQSSIFHQWAIVHVASKTFEAISKICRYGRFPDTTINRNVDKFYRLSFSSNSTLNSDFLIDFSVVLEYCLTTTNKIINEEGRQINHNSIPSLERDIRVNIVPTSELKPCVGFYREVMIAEAACCRWAFVLIYDLCALNGEMRKMFSSRYTDGNSARRDDDDDSFQSSQLSPSHKASIIDIIITSLQRFSVVIEEASRTPLTRKKRDVGARGLILSALVACDAASRAIVNLSNESAKNTALIGRGGGCVCLVQILRLLMSLRTSLKILMAATPLSFANIGASIEDIEEASRVLAQSVCLAIGNLSAVDENRSRLLQLSLPELLVSCGREESASPDVCEAVCGSIANLVSASSVLSGTFSGSLSWDGRCRLVSSSCSEFLVNVFWVHYQSPKTITAACLAMGNICITPADAPVVLENARERISGITDSHRIIMNGLRSCFSHCSANHSVCNCECLCVAVANLCYKNATNRNLMVDQGVCSLIANVLLAHSPRLDTLNRNDLNDFLTSDEATRSSAVIGQAALAVGNLSSTDEIRLVFTELDGVCASLVQVLRNYNISYLNRSPNSKPIGGAGRACFAIARLLEIPAAIKKFEMLKLTQILDTIVHSELIPDHVIREARHTRDLLPFNRKL